MAKLKERLADEVLRRAQRRRAAEEASASRLSA
jgi:hypothetical protein